MSEIEPKASAAYYLLPIFLGVLGGIIGYLVLRKRDGKKARNCLIIGISITAVGTVGLLAIGASVGGPIGGTDPRVDISVDRLNEAISFMQESLEECRQADSLAELNADFIPKLIEINRIEQLVNDIGYAGLAGHEKIRPLGLELTDLVKETEECFIMKQAEFSE